MEATEINLYMSIGILLFSPFLAYGITHLYDLIHGRKNKKS